MSTSLLAFKASSAVKGSFASFSTPMAAISAKAGFDVVMTCLVVLFLFKGGIKLASAWQERQSDERLWGIIGGIGQAVAIPMIWAIMAYGGWTPGITGSATALP